jgi:hypothetical protein
MIRGAPAILTLITLGSLASADPCRSGLKVNQRPGPYSSVVCTGPLRGQLHCFICEAEDKPMVIIFARRLSEPLGKLAHAVDQAVTRHKELRAWITFLAEDQASLDPQVVGWGKKNAVGNLPLAVFEDTIGPPSYLLNREADVTVLLAVQQKVAANFAYRAGEMNDTAVAEILRTLPRILGSKK